MTTEGEGVQGDANDGQSDVEETTGSGSTEADDSAQSGADKPNEETVPKSELERLRARMQAADQRAGKAEQELAKIRDKDMPALEKANRDLAEAQKQVEALSETNRSLALRVAFLQDNTYQWHNPERALKLLDLDGVEIDDSGRVTGLKEAVAALAKSDAYLIKPAEDKDQKSPPGTAAGNNGSSGGGKPDSSKLARRLPVLNTRVKRP